MLYSREGLSGDGFNLVLRHLREGGERSGMWRTVPRLVSFGQPVRAAILAATLATS